MSKTTLLGRLCFPSSWSPTPCPKSLGTTGSHLPPPHPTPHPTPPHPSAGVYVGGLPRDAPLRDVEEAFGRFGRVRSTDLKTGFAFITYLEERDAEQAVREMRDRDFLGRRLKVELAKEPRLREERLTDEHRNTRGRPEARVLVTGLPPGFSWQELKDLGKETGGGVLFSDVSTVQPHGTFGILEFSSGDAAQAAIRALDGKAVKEGATIRAEVARNSSLKISSESGPA